MTTDDITRTMTMREARALHRAEVADASGFKPWARQRLRHVPPSQMTPKLARIVHGRTQQ